MTTDPRFRRCAIDLFEVALDVPEVPELLRELADWIGCMPEVLRHRQTTGKSAPEPSVRYSAPLPAVAKEEAISVDQFERTRAAEVTKPPEMGSCSASGEAPQKPKRRSDFRDLTGQTCGTWTVIEEAAPDKNGKVYWNARHVCGAVRRIRGVRLRNYPPEKCSGCRSAGPEIAKSGKLPAPAKKPEETRAAAPSSEVAKSAPPKVPPAIDPGLLGESIRSLVRTTAARIAVQHGADRQELMKFGMMAAERAARQWDPATGQPLITYAHKLIREAMIEHARKVADGGDEDALLAQSMDAARGDDPNRKGWHTATHRLPPGSEEDETEDEEGEEEAAE